MKVHVTVRDDDGRLLGEEELDGFYESAVVTVHRTPDQVKIDAFVPLEVDDHPDTLGQIGHQVVKHLT